MDPSLMLDMLGFIQTEEGQAVFQRGQELADYYRHEIALLMEAFSNDDFENSESLQQTVLKCLNQITSKEGKEMFQKTTIYLTCDKIHKELDQGCDLFQAFEFLNQTLVILDEVCMLDETQFRNEILRNQLFAECDSRLWRTLFYDTTTWKENFKKTQCLLESLKELADKNWKANPAFCCQLATNLKMAYGLLIQWLPQDRYTCLMAKLNFLQAKCCYQAKQYRHTILQCKKVSELEENVCFVTYELWAKALHDSGQHRKAIDTLDSALIFMENESIKSHLQKQIEDIRKDMPDDVSSVTSSSSDADSDWLEGTTIHMPELQQEQAKVVRESHVKKPRHSRPKRVNKTEPLSPSAWFQPRGQHPLNVQNYQASDGAASSVPLPSFKEINLPSDCDDSDVEDAIQMPETRPDEAQAQIKLVAEERSDQTWFEESRQKREVEEISCGMVLDVDTRGFMGKQDRHFYRQLEPVDELERRMASEPNVYKRCKIEFESSHKAICRLITSEQNCTEIEIHGRSKCGQVFNGDEVCVEILMKQTNAPPSPGVKIEDKDKIFGRVAGVLKSSFKRDQHIVLACTCDDEEGFLMHPLCKSIPKIHVLNGVTKKKYPSLSKYRIDTYKVEDGELKFKKYFDVKPGTRGRYVFLVAYLTWGSQHVYPLGAVLEVLECGTGYSGGIKKLEMQYKVPRYFSPKTVEYVEKMLQQRTPKTDNRLDCRGLTVFTIDPAHSKDLDDALSISRKDDCYLVGVHIADVAAVVKKGDAVDREAEYRATSFYPDGSRVRHMLPEPLSEHQCSLLPNEERLAISVFFHIDKSGKIVKGEPDIKRTLIKSSLKMSYGQAQNIIDGKKVEEGVKSEIRESVALLNDIAQGLRKDRLGNSRFAVPFEDTRFLDAENPDETFEAHALVEEFMIKANSTIATWLMKKFAKCTPIRSHARPSDEDLQQFQMAEENYLDFVVDLQGKEIVPGKEIDVEKWTTKGKTGRQELLPIQAKIWQSILNSSQKGHMKTVVQKLCTDEAHPLQAIALQNWRSILDTAEYKCSNKSYLKHFSLNIEVYTHFTSPIRRYVDLVVHRLVHAALDSKPSPYKASEVDGICAYINDATSRQKHFSKACKALKMADKMSQQPVAMDAIIKDVSDNGADLYMPSGKHITGKSRELPFHLMNLHKKPEKKEDTNLGKPIMTMKWKKRLYDCTGCPQQLTHCRKYKGPQKITINPFQNVCFVDKQTWARVLQACFNNQSGDVRKILDKQPVEGREPPLREIVKDIVTSEVGDGSIQSLQTKFMMCLGPGRVLKLQMTAKPQKGILTPEISLIHICKNLSLCLTHMEDPVNQLSRSATESAKNKQIESVSEYKRLWMPLLEMEAATSAVINEENVVVSNVRLELTQRSRECTGNFTLPVKFVMDRSINFGGKSLERLKEMKKTKGKDLSGERASVDYLCIRSEVQTSSERPAADSYTWVAHAQVLKVRLEDSDFVTVEFKLNAETSPVPESLLPGCTGTVEVLFKSEVDRVAMKTLAILEGDVKDLASCIALNRRPPKLDKDRRDLGEKIEKEVQIKDLPLNNVQQHSAIERALTSSFSLIQGPPGTGKTYTGIKLVYLFNKINNIRQKEEQATKKGKILYCGPSNKSVDLVAWLLLKKLGDKCPKIIRMYGSNIVTKEYPLPKGNFMSKKATRNQASDYRLRNVTLHHMIRQPGKEYAEEILKYDHMFRSNPDAVTQTQIKSFSKLVYMASCKELTQCDVILTTCGVGGNGKLAPSDNMMIYQCIIDECAMCSEPQSMIPIINSKAKQVVLIGDHKQLRPITKSREAAELGLDQSLFERYAGQATLLNTQYRMNPRLCEFPSKMFYEGKLLTGPSVSWRITEPLKMWPVAKVPHVFVHVEGLEESLSVATEEGNEQSKSNRAECEKVCEVFNWLVEKEHVDPKYINIISQYNAQCHRIREKLTKYRSRLNVNTVVTSQGGEWDYIIFSTVRSLPQYKIEQRPTLGWKKHNLGFITDANQINVALTRAHKGLVIIGNEHLLKCDDTFKSLLDHYTKQGCFVYGDEFPRRSRQPRRRAPVPGAEWRHA